ncbi:hypothetical protein [Thalassobacillus sp. CUG 92003]|uniref:hypothetical protein n=1 Tax=Thalassobacillus sp. CUG 92003 TaxID=2736641 RepID=UPI0015E6D80C|nr:hypothetical protein [Thalassobacillus sp. CUG 92003]
MNTFTRFFDMYQDIWHNGDVLTMKDIVSTDLVSREVYNSHVYDHGFGHMIASWDYIFNFFADKNVEWEFEVEKHISLRQDEVMSVFWLTMLIEGQKSDSTQLFVQTFHKDKSTDKWQLIRNYTETSLPETHEPINVPD